MFKEIYVFRIYYSIMIPSKFNSILPKNGKENGTETQLLAQKCIMKNAFHHTNRCVLCIEMDSFWKHVIYVWIV